MQYTPCRQSMLLIGTGDYAKEKDCSSHLVGLFPRIQLYSALLLIKLTYIRSVQENPLRQLVQGIQKGGKSPENKTYYKLKVKRKTETVYTSRTHKSYDH